VSPIHINLQKHQCHLSFLLQNGILHWSRRFVLENLDHNITRQVCIWSCGPWEYIHRMPQASANWDLIWVSLHKLGTSHACFYSQDSYETNAHCLIMLWQFDIWCQTVVILLTIRHFLALLVIKRTVPPAPPPVGDLQYHFHSNDGSVYVNGTKWGPLYPSFDNAVLPL
jgi:hypothetical protein